MAGFSSAELNRASTASLERAVNLLIDRIPNTRKGETRKAMSEQFAQICGELSKRGMRIEVPSFLASEIRHERGMQAQIRWIKKNLGLPKQEAVSTPTVQVTSSTSKTQPRNAFSNFGDALKHGGLINEFTADYLKGRHSGIATLSNFDRDVFLSAFSSDKPATPEVQATEIEADLLTETETETETDASALESMTDSVTAEVGSLYSDEGLIEAIAPSEPTLATDKPRIRLNPKVTPKDPANNLASQSSAQTHKLLDQEGPASAVPTLSPGASSRDDWMSFI